MLICDEATCLWKTIQGVLLLVIERRGWRTCEDFRIILISAIISAEGSPNENVPRQQNKRG
jgi:hypothetical protein